LLPNIDFDIDDLLERSSPIRASSAATGCRRRSTERLLRIAACAQPVLTEGRQFGIVEVIEETVRLSDPCEDAWKTRLSVWESASFSIP